MEFIIAILIIVLAYYLVEKIGRNQEQLTDKKSNTWGKHPAFTKNEWDEAVCDWYSVSFEHDSLAYPGLPYFVPPFDPPDYDEVKHDRSELEKLVETTKFMREDIDNLNKKSAKR